MRGGGRLGRGGTGLVEGDQAASQGGEEEARTNGQRTLPTPPAGGWSAIESRALTIGAPAKTIDITTAGLPFAPKARRTQKAPDSSDGAGEQRPGHALDREDPGGAAQLEDQQRREHGGQEVGDPHEEEGLVAAAHGIGHGHLAGVQEDAVEPPGDDGHQGEDEPAHGVTSKSQIRALSALP